MNDIKTICVFASSANNIDKKYYLEACNLGIEIAKYQYDIVYGGSTRGLMGEVTKNAKQNGSKITGVMPEKLYNLGINEGNCTKFILTKGMRERKAKMDELSQAVIALPGGFGTLEELSEMIVQKQLGYNNKPIVLLNTNGFYNNLIAFYNQIIEENFAPKVTCDICHFANNAQDAINYIKNYQYKEKDYLNIKLEINK